MDGQDLVTVIAITGVGALLVLGVATGFTFSLAGHGGQPVTGACASSAYNAANEWKLSDSAINAGGSSNSLTSPTGNYFLGNGNAFVADNPGSLSSAVTSSGSYSLQAGNIVQVTSTGAYPIEQAINVPANTQAGQPFVAQTEGGQNVLTVLPASTSTAGVCAWALQVGQILAPASGTSATTNVAALVSSSDGASFASADSYHISTSAVTWTVALNLKEAGVGAGYVDNTYSTSASTVVNYANGGAATVPNGQSVPFQYVLFVFSNRTTFNIALPSGSPLTIAPITNTAMTAATNGYAISGFTGCNVATSAATTACLSAQLSIYSSASSTSNHNAITFIWVGETQPGYGVAHATDPAVTSFPSLGAAAGIPSGFAGLTVPTTAPDNGAPTILIEQSYTVISYSS